MTGVVPLLPPPPVCLNGVDRDKAVVLLKWANWTKPATNDSLLDYNLTLRFLDVTITTVKFKDCGRKGLGIAAGYGLDSPRFEPQWGHDFPYPFALTQTPLPGLFPGRGVKADGA